MAALLGGVTVVSLLCLALNATVEAAASAQDLYISALARERTVRAALAEGEPPARVHADVRAVVAAYREVVRRFPRSGYSDNALWQAGVLSLDAFAVFGQERDKTTGTRLLRLLASEYPTSSRVKEVSAQLTRADRPRATAEAAPRESADAPREAADRADAAVGTDGPDGLATIRDIRRETLPGAVRITIELDREVPFHDERIDGPVRVFVDLPSTRTVPGLVDKTLRFDSDNDIVRQVRIGRHPGNMTRVVLDAVNVSSYSVYPLYHPYRLVIDCLRGPQPAVAAASSAAGPAPPAAVPAAATPAAAAVRAPDALPAVTATTAPPRNADGGYSMARQLGLSVSRIVIDPGHGGHDPGAKVKSMEEADLVLDIALRVEKLLQKIPGVEVILTRRTDEFIPLPERTAIANREGADLFLSIHANASPNKSARGIETYFLNFASNMSAASVAARENAASGQAMGALPDFLKAIALNNKLAESRDFAAAVQDAMVDRLRKANKSVKDLGVKQAPFVVLIGAAMPSVLAEVSFLTNAQEAKLLRGTSYRQRIAEALVAAIRKYQTSLKAVARVAQQ